MENRPFPVENVDGRAFPSPFVNKTSILHRKTRPFQESGPQGEAPRLVGCAFTMRRLARGPHRATEGLDSCNHGAVAWNGAIVLREQVAIDSRGPAQLK